MNATYGVRCYLVIALMAVATLVLTLPVQAMPLPPRPTVQPAESPASAAPDGAWIRLEATFPEAWPWMKIQWQTPWTTVEWQDAQGDWHLVEGWRGQLDTVQPATPVVGVKTWWLGHDICGHGPFRWLVYSERDGNVLGISDAFMLPCTVGETISVTVALP